MAEANPTPPVDPAPPTPPVDSTPPADPPAAPPVPPADPPADPTPPAEPPKDAEPPKREVPAPDGYKLPEGMPLSVAKFAHDNDMTQAQLDSTIKYYNEMVTASQQAETTAMRQEGEALVKAWGNKADYNLSLVRRALAQNDPDGSLKQLLESTGFGNHPAVLKFFLKIGNSMKEGGFLKGAVNTPPGKQSTAQVLFGKTHPSAEG